MGKAKIGVLLGCLCQCVLWVPLANCAPGASWFSQPDAQLIRQREGEQNQRLVLGDVKKVSAEWVSEVDVHLYAPYRDSLYQFPRGTELLPVLQSWRAGREALRGQIVHECQGRQCGGSSFYANLVFEVRTLYGRDDDQAYAVWMSADQSLLVSFYAVVRGNRTVQVLIRETPLNKKHAATLLNKMGTRPISMPGLQSQAQFFLTLNKGSAVDWAASDSELKKLKHWLQSQGQTQAYLVLYNHVSGSLVETQQTTQSQLQQLIERLSESGVAVKHLEPVGAGAIRVTPKQQMLLEWVVKP